MPNPEQLAILKRGVETWNRWCAQNLQIAGATRPCRADLRRADLTGACLSGVDLKAANLQSAVLRGADLRGAWLRGADLTCADLRGADLRDADLSLADLPYADLRWAKLDGAMLTGADLWGATIGWTIFGDNDLSEVRWLNFAKCYGGSRIDAGTIKCSSGRIPNDFLRACGAPDDLIQLASTMRNGHNGHGW